MQVMPDGTRTWISSLWPVIRVALYVFRLVRICMSFMLAILKPGMVRPRRCNAAAAMRQGSRYDRIVSAMTVSMVSVPVSMMVRRSRSRSPNVWRVMGR